MVKSDLSSLPPPDPFNTHQIETNLGIKKPEDLQKFVTKKGKNSFNTVINWCSTEKNRVTHLIQHKVWIGKDKVLKEVGKYGDFTKLKLDKMNQGDQAETKETSKKVQALASLFVGTEVEEDVAKLMHLEDWQKAEPISEEQLVLRELNQTITKLSLSLGEDKILKPKDADSAQIEQDILLALRGNPKFHKKIARLKKKFPPNSPERQTLTFLIDKAKAQKKLQEAGLDPKLADQDYKSVQQLINSRLIYNIAGFQNTTASGPQVHAIKVDAEQRLMIKKEGQWVPLQEIMQDLEIDKSTALIGLVEKKHPNDPDKVRQRWNYFSPNGLVPVDRYKHPEMYPVEKLSKQDMGDLLTHAQSFQEGPPDPTKNCVIQIFTNPRNLTSHDDNFFLSRLSASQPVHAGIRIIYSDGTVYSTGLSGLPDEQAAKEGAGNLLVTVNSAPAILDFEEFRPHEGRIVTSIPVTEEVFKETMETLNLYRKETLRFNLARQNCVLLATEVLGKAGVKTENELTVPDLMAGILPSPRNIAVVGKPIKAVDQKIEQIKTKVIESTPKPVVKAAKIPKRVVWFVPNSLSKLLLIGLGGTRGTAKINKEGKESLENKEEMANFSHLFPSTQEVFKDNSIQLYYSLPLIQWQLKQKSTAVHAYSGKPAMGIIPPKDEAKAAGEERREVFYKRFITNFE